MGHLYSNFKIFHYRDKLDSFTGDNKQPTPPVHVRLKPTNVCNHNCSYCAYRMEQLQLGQDMSVKDQIPKEKMMEIVDDFHDMNVEAVTFSGGGEPFCYPHLTETVEKLAEHGIRFAALTNGSRLKGRAAELFSRHGAWVRVSMDGWDGPSYARYRGVGEDEFNKVMSNIEAFQNLGGECYLGVVIIVDQNNQAHVLEMLKKLRSTGAHSVKVAPCIMSNDQRESRDYHQGFFESVHNQVREAQELLAGDDFEIFDSYDVQLTTFKKKYHWCPYIQINPVIGADLNVYACHDKAYNLKNGFLFSIKDRSFKNAWMNGRADFLKIDPARDCNHHCVVNGKNLMILEYLELDPDHVMFV